MNSLSAVAAAERGVAIERNSTLNALVRRGVRWHWIYYALAAIAVLTIAGGLYLSHMIMGIYTGSVAENRTWAERLGRIADLGAYAGAVNAPGNDVFDSRDVAKETARLDAAVEQFDAYFGEIVAELQANAAVDGAEVVTALESVKAAMAQMLEEAELIFSHFRNHDPTAAGERMATMDRRYADVGKAIDGAVEAVQRIQEWSFSRQLQEADDVRTYEYGLGAMIAVIVVFLTVYGYVIGRVMKSQQNSVARSRAEQELTIQRLTAAMDSVDDGFVLYDADDRLMLFNERFLDLFKTQRKLFVAGRSYREILEVGLAQGLFPKAAGREKDWMRSQLKDRGQRQTSLEHQMPNGRWVDVLERRTPEGGIVTIYRDVTERKSAAAAAARFEADRAERAARERAADDERQRLEQRFQQDLAAFVESAAAGDLSKRIDLAGRGGLMLQLGEGMNRWADAVAAALGEVVEMMSALADGNLSKRIVGDYKGDLLRLKSDCNATAEKLAGIVGRTVEGMATIKGATEQLTAGARDLSARTEEQVASLEEMAASIRQMAVTVKQNADNARQANELAVTAQGSAENGGGIVAAAVSAVGRIEESAQKIADIVGMIDEIAFQTNLLALNAAVEAARAGDSGRGFAVVAEEVRALAQRSSEASKEIRGLIAAGNHQVKRGVELVNDAGTSLQEIVASVKRVAEIVSEIAAASQEQSEGIQQIDDTVTQLEGATQKNASLVEESTASLNAVDRQVDGLMDLVGVFRAARQLQARVA